MQDGVETGELFTRDNATPRESIGSEEAPCPCPLPILSRRFTIARKIDTVSPICVQVAEYRQVAFCFSAALKDVEVPRGGASLVYGADPCGDRFLYASLF